MAKWFLGGELVGGETSWWRDDRITLNIMTVANFTTCYVQSYTIMSVCQCTMIPLTKSLQKTRPQAPCKQMLEDDKT